MCFDRLFCRADKQKEILESYEKKKALLLRMDHSLDLLAIRMAENAKQKNDSPLNSYDRIKKNSVNWLIFAYCGRDFQLNEWQDKSLVQADKMRLLLSEDCKKLAAKLTAPDREKIDQELEAEFNVQKEKKILIPCVRI